MSMVATGFMTPEATSAMISKGLFALPLRPKDSPERSFSMSEPLAEALEFGFDAPSLDPVLLGGGASLRWLVDCACCSYSTEVLLGTCCLFVHLLEVLIAVVVAVVVYEDAA